MIRALRFDFDLNRKTIKSYLEHFGLIAKIDEGFLYKDDLVIFEFSNDIDLLIFLEGMSCVLDNKHLWNSEVKK